MNHLDHSSSRCSSFRACLVPPAKAVAVIAAFLWPGISHAQSFVTSLYQANNAVRAVAVSGNTIYLGGSFGALEIPTGGAVAVAAGADAEPAGG